MIELDGIGTSAEECVSGFEAGAEFEGFDEVAHGFVLSHDSFPFAFPHDNDAVALGE